MSEKLIFKTKFGSHLYGTQTEKSDTDYKGVFLPDLDKLILQDVPNSINNITKKIVTNKNSKDDIDQEFYSLYYFLQLAFQGETVALDMLHCPLDFAEIVMPEWEYIHANRSLFYTKHLKAYIGYCRKQASKYGIKGSRLSDAENVLNYLKSIENKTLKLSAVWDKIPTGENIKFLEIEDAHQQDKRALDVCARKIMADTRIQYAVDCIQKFYDSYGQRALQAKENQGIDWKAISHAFRAGFQLKEIYETGDLKYPLKEAKFLKDIKQGKYHYQNDGIANRLDTLINEVELLAEKSNYPEKCDKEYWNNWLLGLYKC